MSRKSIIIIGAGIAGLSAGCYAVMNGYDTVIFEAHDKPGGLCTSWNRRGYTIDGCIHHLAGSGPGSELYRVWQELGALEGRGMVFHDEFVRVEDPEGRAFTVYTDIDRLEQHMKQLSIADAEVIEEYTRAARRFLNIDLLAFGLLKPWQIGMKALPRIGDFIKWGKITLEDFAQKFKDPFLRKAFPVIQYGFSGIPMLIHLNFLAGCHNRTLGWPSGGSLQFARSIERHYTALGGRIHYRSRVEKILTEDNKAVGVRLSDGSEHRADTIVSAADGHTTIFGMLEGKYIDDGISKYYQAAPDYLDMSLQVSLGAARDMSREPHALALFLEDPLEVSGKKYERLDIEIFNFDKNLAPPGKTVIKAMFGASYGYWKDLRADRERYEYQKQEIARAVIDRLDKRFPGLKGQVEMVDVATPVTFENYTGNWKGLQAWMPPDGGFGTMMNGFTRSLPGLDNFYMAGQWAEAMIGISTAALSGRNLVRHLCKKYKRLFVTK